MPAKQKQVTFTRWNAIEHTQETGDDALHAEVNFVYMKGATLTDGALRVRLTPGAPGGDVDFFIVGTVAPFALTSMADAVKKYYVTAFKGMIDLGNAKNITLMNVTVATPLTYLVDVTEESGGGW